MAWVVGVDEAGYGPNLGPLVQAAAALRLPDHDPGGYDALAAVVRRARGRADGRLVIDDSKAVYARGGLAALELAAHAVYATGPGPLADFLRRASAESVEDLRAEPWFDPGEPLPVAAAPDVLTAAAARWASACPNTHPQLAVNVVPAPRFNRVCDAAGSKGAVLAGGLVRLLAATLDALPADGEPVEVRCDKQGGRNYYAPLIQQAFPGGWVVAEREGATESRYRVEGLGRAVTVTLCPRADCGSVAVALASMVCKYVREVCMRQFNRFWATHVPGVQPTAGYPVDARRFYAEIRAAVTRLGLTDDQVWRKR